MPQPPRSSGKDVGSRPISRLACEGRLDEVVVLPVLVVAAAVGDDLLVRPLADDPSQVFVEEEVAPSRVMISMVRSSSSLPPL